MALINCPECDNKVSNSAPACPNCGFEVKSHVEAQRIAEKARKKRKSLTQGCFGCAGLLILGFFGIALLASLSPVEEPKKKNFASRTGKPEVARRSVEEDTPTVTENSEVLTADQSEKAALDAQEFQILRDELEEGKKRTVEIRLSDRLNQLELQLLARKIKARGSADVPRTFISYYLPGMEVGKGAWATSHFNPGLQIEILGPSKGDVVSAPKVDDDRRQLGRWIDNGPAGGTFVIYVDGSTYFAERRFRDGSELTQELIQKASSVGERFEVMDSSHGAYYLVERSGNLRIGDRDRFFTVFEVKGPKDEKTLLEPVLQGLCGALAVYAKRKMIQTIARTAGERRPAFPNALIPKTVPSLGIHVLTAKSDMRGRNRLPKWGREIEQHCRLVIDAFSPLKYIAYSFVEPDKRNPFAKMPIDRLIAR